MIIEDYESNSLTNGIHCRYDSILTGNKSNDKCTKIKVRKGILAQFFFFCDGKNWENRGISDECEPFLFFLGLIGVLDYFAHEALWEKRG